MANPVVNSVTFNPDPASPGGSTQMTIDATDADSQTWTVNGAAVDSQSNSVPFSGMFSVSDPIHLENLVSVPAGLVFTPTGDPLVYTISGF
jgi:hypothetical protein